ncbi:MAG: hypothetical protein ABUK01_04450 [Leptospirales bacterium]
MSKPIQDKILKTGALLFSAAIGISILYAASNEKSNIKTEQVEQIQTEEETPKLTLEQEEECATLKMDYENEKRKYDDKYLSTTKSAAPAITLFELEQKWKEKCKPDSAGAPESADTLNSPDLIIPNDPENK